MVQYLCNTWGILGSMAYTTNPFLPRVRMNTVRLVCSRGWSVRRAAKYTGVHPSTVSRWVRKDVSGGWRPIETRSSRPHHHPGEISSELIQKIIEVRKKHGRCSEVVHQELINQGVKVSLSSVKRTLKRHSLLKERSPWKRYHAPMERPKAQNPGDLVQIDTIHLMKNQKERIYIYTLIDLCSRWAYAWATEKMNCRKTLSFVRSAKLHFPSGFQCLQSDHGPEFSQNFSERVKILHRHSRVRRPNDNAHLERFNRTLQEECLNKIPVDVSLINKTLPHYLKYYNEQRLHLGLNLKTPQQVLQSY